MQTLKICSRCRKEKSFSTFGLDSSRKDGLSNWCKSCVRERRKITEDERQRVILEYKDKPCADCGKSYPPYVMDLDHVRGTKEFSLSWGKYYPIEKILEELEKCEVVCSNCHRIRTFTKRH